MKDNKGQPKDVSTCFEGSPTVEMMLKIMGENGIGSLSEEMMRSLMKKLDEDVEDSQNPNKEEI
jgi:hypothetical protein